MNALRRRKRNGQAGYSLPEMLTVVAIVGVLALVTVPAFINYYKSNKVKASVRNFTTDLRIVRQLAISNGVQSKLTFSTGATGTRAYNFWLGDAAVGTPNWTQRTQAPGGAAGASGYTRMLDDIVYFPANGAATPQTFTDVDSDGTIDIIFFPDGRVQMPAGQSSATISIKTDQKVYKPIFQVDISPSGRVNVH